MKKSVNSNIYGYALDSTWEAFGAFLSGAREALVCVVSAQPVSDRARDAFEKSFDKLGYGQDACTFVTLSFPSPPTDNQRGGSCQGRGSSRPPQPCHPLADDVSGVADQRPEVSPIPPMESQREEDAQGGSCQAGGRLLRQSSLGETAHRAVSVAAELASDPHASHPPAADISADARQLSPPVPLGPAELIFAIIEGLDPLVIVAADAQAAEMLGKAYRTGFDCTHSARLLGRPAISFTSFEDMLDSSDAKQKAWAVLKRLAR